MLDIIVGTKGQLIKMAPVMLEMDRVGVKYKFINAAQHGRILDDISSLFRLREYDYSFRGVGGDVSKGSEMMRWFMVNLFNNAGGGRIFRKNDYVVLHGDATPALLGLIIAKIRGLRTIHIEAGLRTHNWREPFPEELIRVVADRYSDFLFALSDESYLNLKKEGVMGKIWKIRTNTVLDSVRMAVRKGGAISPPSGEYVLVSIHRYETISNYRRMKMLVELVDKVSREFDIVFTIHESTKRQLEGKNFMKKVKNNRRVITVPLLDYFSFVQHMSKAQYVITDGGGPQEETYYLGTPCLVMREFTERPIYPNIYLGGFDSKKSNYFIRNYHKYGNQSAADKFKGYSPSKHIVKLIRESIET